MKLVVAALLVGACLIAAGGQPALAGQPAGDFAWRPRPGARLPLDAALTDERGRTAPLAAFFTGKPVVLVLEYLRCRTLCGVTLERIVAALDAVPLDAGRDFRLVAVSIDPRDSAAAARAARQKYAASYHHPRGESGIHFLTGPEAAVRRIADAVGFPYRYDPALDQYIHPAGFVVATEDGRISRYFFGVDPAPAALEAALTDAQQGRALDPVSRLLLLCHAAGLPVSRYSLPILAAFAVANIGGVAVLVGVFAAVRRRRG